jgi:signal peptidase II
MKKYLLVACLLVLLDQISKLLVITYLDQSYNLISNFLSLVLVYNQGIAFSLPVPSFLIIPVLLGIVVCGTILAYFLGDWENKIWGDAFSLILAGAIGNLIDRIMWGQVIDFIKVGWWPIFNVADILITGGGMLVVYDILLNRKKG